jgi:hypothetical protein
MFTLENLALSPWVWLLLQPFIVFTIVKICRRKSSNAFWGVWNLDFLLWIVTSIVFFDWAFIFILFSDYSSVSVGVNEFERISNILTSYILGNCYGIFSFQFLLFLVSLGRSIYKKDFLMFFHKFLLLLSGFVVLFHISAFIL